jgi:cell division transport system permease protein
MFDRHQEIPLARDRAGRLLPWIIALMIFLAVLATAGAMILLRSVGTLTGGLSGTMTVHLPTGGMSDAEADKRSARAANVLRRTPGVTRVRVLGRDRVAKLVAPWLGDDTRGLPMPRLLDVSLERGAAVNLGEIRRQLRTIVPGAAVVDHQRFVQGIFDLSQWVFLCGLLVGLVVLVACALTIVFATRTSLRIHHNVTEVLNLIGARDSYVAKQFERHTFRQGLIGGAAGTLAAALLLGALGAFAGGPMIAVDGGLVPVWLWVLIATFPFLSAFLARFTARFTVLRTLARMG